MALFVVSNYFKEEISVIEKMSPGSGRMLKENNEWVNTANLLASSLGQDGSFLIRDTTENTLPQHKKFIAIQVLEDASFETLDGNMQGNVTGMEFSAGTILYGRFTKVKLAYGSIIAYLGV